MAVAVSAGGFSTSAAIGDMVIRSAGQLLLQTGSGASAIMINNGTYTYNFIGGDFK